MMFLVEYLQWLLGLVIGLLIYLNIFRPKEKLLKNASIGFFHPFCNACGGGERVLWIAIQAINQRWFAEERGFLRLVVYTGDKDASPKSILARVKERFGIDLLDILCENEVDVEKNRTQKKAALSFIYLDRRPYVLASRYPHFTLLGQSLGSIFLGYEALSKFTPNVFVDTAGYAFTLPLAKYFFNVQHVGAYVHYPTISTDMLQRVFERRPTYNNAGIIAQSRVMSTIKWIYYMGFAFLYSMSGFASDFVMVNSTWTYNHVKWLWGGMGLGLYLERIRIVFPPCDIGVGDRTNVQKKTNLFVSVGQFRPEKDHELQVRSMKELVDRLELNTKSDSSRKRTKSPHKVKRKSKSAIPMLYMIGSCRDAGDEKRVADLRSLISKLELNPYIELKVNAKYADLQKWLAEAAGGLHTMWNEHFGIGVVEMLAFGAIPIAHNSGGPLSDIVKADETVGFLASNPEEYAIAMERILRVEKNSKLKTMRKLGYKRAENFSDKAFTMTFTNCLWEALDL
eukprot:g1691.t1